jgi:hypothetical protein
VNFQKVLFLPFSIASISFASRGRVFFIIHTLIFPSSSARSWQGIFSFSFSFAIERNIKIDFSLSHDLPCIIADITFAHSILSLFALVTL